MTYTTSSFKTRARTIDHLGREQIADCPTAISELWKNAYDAYATEVSLHLFDGEIDVAALFDNGHGMSREEFETKWLTVGTESKTDGSETNEKDRNGLPIRAKQGQKGIGRLSSAALGPVLLLISKRKDMPFVATLIDWRLFENPFIYLDDVRIPITEFDHIHQLADELSTMFDHLMGNLHGNSDDDARTLRLSQAWKQFSEQEIKNGYTTEQTTKSKIENTLIKEVFTERHFNQCPLWNNDAQHGTAMFVAQLQDDLKAQLSTSSIKEADEAERNYRENFFQTLSSFTDPFSKDNEPIAEHFNYSVTVWHGYVPTAILTKYKQFNLAHLEELEHAMEGNVDSEGYFRGRVKVFGQWFENYTVKPKQVYKMRRDSQFGPFHIRVGTFEQTLGKTSLNNEQHIFFSEQAELYGGFRVYRDGLRVMPYGRIENDYFGIEERRSKRAGTHFWASRRMFGPDESPNDFGKNH
ncbi:ATP-binding protein [Proteus mirabilis]|uniref:ATP-binding protein n=1 Tax=Proteus mirabilis TaxID=584 RepID=UPI0021823DB8|nr:ATP-binding protein [Proteus mirabilis]MCT0130528.1 ATP-binding protein [Proteus mirabilis]MDF7354587.1 ATP-binding protein [Proteus mirabilis]